MTLEVSSHYALYPGNYSMSVELMKMERDTSYPVMNLILDGFDDFVFGVNDTIPIRINVSDMYNIDYVKYKITNPNVGENYYEGEWIFLEVGDDGIYTDYFVIAEHLDLNISGSYWINAWACDILGNCGPM